MSDSELIRFAGDVSIQNISVVTPRGTIQNITEQVMAIEIYEDLFSPFMTGIISVKDSFDFVNLLPFIGEEYLDLKINTPSFEEKYHINQQFYIYKVSNRIITGDRMVMYQLHFISKEALADVNKNISKCYQGQISDIAKDLVTNKNFGLESVKKLNIEPTVNKTKFVANFWSPIKSLNYVCGNALNANSAANYIFYENREGFNFKSLESLYKQEPVAEFLYDNYAREVQADGRSVFDLNEDYKRILELDVPVLQDYLERAKSGMFASKIITHDHLTKRWSSRNFDMLEDFSSTEHLNKYPVASKNNVKYVNSLIIDYPKYYGVFNKYGDVSNANSIQRRISQLMQAQSTKLNISVLGRTDYTVGIKVKVKLNKVQPVGMNDSDEDILDTVLSGFYLVSAINHTITRDKHECSMELIKDSYIRNLDEVKK